MRAGTTHVWRIRVTIDGIVERDDEFGADIAWPVTYGALPFPRYDAHLATWCHRPDAELGRIKIEIVEGYQRGIKISEDYKRDTEFHLLKCHAIFNYRYVPFGKWSTRPFSCS